MTNRSKEWIDLNRQIRGLEKSLQMTPDDHPGVVQSITGKTSLRECNEFEMAKVADTLKARLPKRGGKKFEPSKHAHVRKIWKLWGILKAGGKISAADSNKALLSFVNGMRAEDHQMDQIGQLEWLTAEDASPIIEALKAMCKRNRLAVL